MAERSRRTKGNVDKLAEYKRVREGGTRKLKVQIALLALDRVLTR
jgi:DNA polymerase alpha subunit A